jgi:hypothetical protein
LKTASSALLVTRLSYRILFGHQTARAGRIASARQTLPATLLRSTQAFLRNRASDSVCGFEGNRPRLDLLLAEQAAFTRRKTRETDR